MRPAALLCFRKLLLPGPGIIVVASPTASRPLQWLAAGGKDLTTRVFSLHPIEGYRPPTLAGHREPLVAGELQALPLVAPGVAAGWEAAVSAREDGFRTGSGSAWREGWCLRAASAGSRRPVACPSPYRPPYMTPPPTPPPPPPPTPPTHTHTPPPRAVHFTTAKLQESAGLIGKEAPLLYTLSRDGALFAWSYRKPEAPPAPLAAQRQQLAGSGRKRRRSGAGEEDASGSSGGEDEEVGGDAEGEGSSSGSEEETEEEEEEEAVAAAARGSQPPGAQQQQQVEQQSETYAGGHWKLTEKHYFNQRGAKLSSAAFQVCVRPACVG